jgi:alkylation response protein AidB-like acyl-CoA dehydrogenase
MTTAAEEARRVAEGARQKRWSGAAFVRDLMNGRLRLDLVHPWPDVDSLVGTEARAFLDRLEPFLAEQVDPVAIDAARKIPDDVVAGLREMGAFGLKTPREYGGHGFTQLEYNRILTLIASHDASVAALVSAHQSIGVPQPVRLFGTDEQKAKYLPRTAAGELSAFALTEPDVGSDPGRLRTTAEPTDDGGWVLNGEKLWCTNGTVASFLVVMARIPDGRITAFIVDADRPGVTVTHRCHFMGINAIENAVIRLENVKVPAGSVLGELGKGLKLALITLNAQRIACMASHTFAMQAASELSTAMYDRGGFDIRLEAALGKLFATEHGWRIVDMTLQISGGRGYEKESSQTARGDIPLPTERLFRDFRVKRIFEGSSEILRLFIAREALDPHLRVAGKLVEGKLSLLGKLLEFPKVAGHYARWYPARFFGWGCWPRFSEFGRLATHVRFVDRTSRRLARAVFHMMALHGEALQHREALIFRAVDVGADLFAMSATVSRAHAAGDDESIELADLFCRTARDRVRSCFRGMRRNHDVRAYRAATGVLDGKFASLTDGIVRSTEV